MRAALILLLGAGMLQAAQGPQVAQAAQAAPLASARPDESALRFYASQKQNARVAAETERLRRRFPGWQPPADLWTAEPGGEDEGPLWDLLSAGRLAELQSAIAERSRLEAGWKPSSALARALARRTLREEALNLVKGERWIALAALADARKADLDAGDAELAWAVAEAMGRTERSPEALALLKRMMESANSSPEERRVTILRGMGFLSMGDVDGLLALGRPGDFDAIRIDIVRGRISAVLHDEAGQSVSEEDLSTFEAYAGSASDPNQPALIAWYSLKRRELPTALAWFKRAIARGGDAMVAHGLAQTLRQLGLRREAEDVAYAWREPLVNNSVLFIDLLETDLTREIPPQIEPERLKRYAEVTAATASGEGAQALAWYAYNNCQFDAALGWFKRAVAWFPKQDTVYGYALTLRRVRDQRGFVELVNRYDGQFPKVVDLLFQPPSDHPMPCEQAPARSAALPASVKAGSGYLDLAQRAEPALPGRGGRVPGPEDLAGTERALPQIRRNEFPIAVQMENDLRFVPTGGTQINGAAWSKRAIGRPPTTARRVPGAGPMPYERFGFALKPAWNGEEAPSAPTASEKPAPIGSLWSDEAAARAVDASSGPVPLPQAEIGQTGSILPNNRAIPRSATQ